MPRRRLPLALLPVLALLAAAGCISSDRMGRSLPWGETPRPGQVHADRVNVWPLLYHAGDMTSVLWPLVDVDARGFAIRPLLVQDGSRWSLLFPLSGWNTDTGEGWFATAYRGRHNDGLFPLFNLGDSFSYATLAWWTDAGSYGLFPAAGKFDHLYHAGPVYWERGDDPRAGLFPLLHVNPGDSAWLFPLYSYTDNVRYRRHLLGLGLLGGWNRHRSPERSTSWMTPVWFGRRTADSRTDLLLPLYWYQTDGPRRSFVTPLGGRGWATDGSHQMVNVLGPLFHYSSSGSDQRLTALLWPVFIDSRRPGPARWTLLLPLFGRWHGPEGRGLLTPLGGAGHTTRNNTRWVNVAGPVFHHIGRGDDSYDTTVAWPLFQAFRDADGTHGSDVFALYDYRSGPNLWRLDALAWLFAWERRGPRDGAPYRTVRIFPLYDAETAPALADVRILFGLLARYDRAEDRSRFSILQYLYRRERDGERTAIDLFPFIALDRGPDSRRDTFLWRLYDYHRQGDRRGGHLLFIPWGDNE